MDTHGEILCEHYRGILGLTDEWKVEGEDIVERGRKEAVC
jgi:hypothetical protein